VSLHQCPNYGGLARLLDLLLNCTLRHRMQAGPLDLLGLIATVLTRAAAVLAVVRRVEKDVAGIFARVLTMCSYQRQPVNIGHDI
jgi:hypothetical protein